MALIARKKRKPIPAAPPVGPVKQSGPGGPIAGGPVGPRGPVPGPRQLSPGFDWNPISWVSSAADWTASQLASATDWVGSSIGAAAGWTVNEVQKVGSDVAGFVAHGLDGLWRITLHVFNAVHHVIAEVNHELYVIGGHAVAAFRWVLHAELWFVDRFTGAIGHFVHTYIAPLIGGVVAEGEHLFHQAESAVSAVDGELVHLATDVVGPVVTFVEHAPAWFGHEFDSAWHTVWTDVVAPAVHEAEAVAHEADQLISYGVGDIISAVELVVKAAEWLVWMGEHTFAEIAALPGELTHSVTLADVLKAAAPDVGVTADVEHAVADLFGL